MKFPIYRSTAEHLEDPEELERDNDRRRLTGKPTRVTTVDPPKPVTTTRFSFRPFTEGEEPYAVVETPGFAELKPTRHGTLALYVSAQGANELLTAWHADEAVRRRWHGLYFALPPLDLKVNKAVVKAGETWVGSLYDLKPFTATDAGDLKVIPDGTVRLSAPANSKIIENLPEGPRIGVPTANGSFLRFTAAEAVDQAVRRTGVFAEVPA